jgi:hypothetical protein
LSIYQSISLRAAARLFLAAADSRGGGFPFRFNFSPKARCALRLGEGPRALGFSISIQIVGRLCLPRHSLGEGGSNA